MTLVRKAQLGDVEGIQNVFYKTWLVTYPNEEAGVTVDDVHDRFKDAMSPERLEKRRKDIEENTPDQQLMDTGRRFFVAINDELVVGICRVSRKELGNHLDALYVLPDYQGQGIGTKLWEAAHAHLGSERNIHVEVATYNSRAIDFYTKHGFLDTGRRFTEERLKMKSGSNIPQMEMVLKAS